MPVEIRNSAQKTELVGSDGNIYVLELDMINQKINLSHANGIKILDKENLVKATAFAEVVQMVAQIATNAFNPAPPPVTP